MPLPEVIPVRYTEEEAEYLSVRPVVRQSFRMHEMADMILGVTGKDVERVRQILRSGTVVFHFYRYWWSGFEADAGELATLLARFPDPWPQRPFCFAECVAVELETSPGHTGLRLERGEAARRRWLRRRSVWQALGALAENTAPRYETYSYAQRADQYAVTLDAEQGSALRADTLRCATRAVAHALARLPAIYRALYFCPRSPVRSTGVPNSA